MASCHKQSDEQELDQTDNNSKHSETTKAETPIKCLCEALLEKKVGKARRGQLVITYPMPDTISGTTTGPNGELQHVPLGPVIEIIIDNSGIVSGCRIRGEK